MDEVVHTASGHQLGNKNEFALRAVLFYTDSHQEQHIRMQQLALLGNSI